MILQAVVVFSLFSPQVDSSAINVAAALNA